MPETQTRKHTKFAWLHLINLSFIFIYLFFLLSSFLCSLLDKERKKDILFFRFWDLSFFGMDVFFLLSWLFSFQEKRKREDRSELRICIFVFSCNKARQLGNVYFLHIYGIIVYCYAALISGLTIKKNCIFLKKKFVFLLY